MGWRWRLLPYTIIQGVEGQTVKAFSAGGALRKVALQPGARVQVWVPSIVQGKRVRAALAGRRLPPGLKMNQRKSNGAGRQAGGRGP